MSVLHKQKKRTRDGRHINQSQLANKAKFFCSRLLKGTTQFVLVTPLRRNESAPSSWCTRAQRLKSPERIKSGRSFGFIYAAIGATLAREKRPWWSGLFCVVWEFEKKKRNGTINKIVIENMGLN